MIVFLQLVVRKKDVLHFGRVSETTVIVSLVRQPPELMPKNIATNTSLVHLKVIWYPFTIRKSLTLSSNSGTIRLFSLLSLPVQHLRFGLRLTASSWALTTEIKKVFSFGLMELQMTTMSGGQVNQLMLVVRRIAPIG